MKKLFIFPLLLAVTCAIVLAGCGRNTAEPIAVFPDAKFESQTFEYDGSEHEIVVTGAPKDAEITYAQNRASQVGTYRAFVHIKKDDKEQTLSALLTISKIQFKNLTFDNKTFTYDGTEKNLLVTGDIPNDVDVIYTVNGEPFDGATDAGVYDITATLTGNNYETEVMTAALTINKADITAKFDGKSVTYNGNNQMIYVADLPAGTEATYTDKDGKPFTGATKPKIEDGEVAGYQITAHISGKNYNSKQLTANFTINKATIKGLSMRNKTVAYDGTVKNLTITGTVPDGVTVEYRTIGGTFNGAVEPGSYGIHAIVHGGDCYEDINDNNLLYATLIISETSLDAPTGVTVDGDNLIWNEVADANRYYINLCNENGDITHTIENTDDSKGNPVSITDTTFAVKSYLRENAYFSADYWFSVTAVPYGQGTAPSIPSQHVKYTLSEGRLLPPNNVRVENNSLMWDKVDQAVIYGIRVVLCDENGTEISRTSITTSATSMALTSIISEAGSQNTNIQPGNWFKFQVRAAPGSDMGGSPVPNITLASEYSEFTEPVEIL